MPTVEGEWIDIPFEPDIADVELQRRIMIRLTTPNAAEEDQVVRARQALAALKQIRDGTSTMTAANQARLFARVLIVLIIRMFKLKDAE